MHTERDEMSLAGSSPYIGLDFGYAHAPSFRAKSMGIWAPEMWVGLHPVEIPSNVGARLDEKLASNQHGAITSAI